ncbi:MAG TPA: peptidoglycan-binding domain-containing protein [Conexibacter sp.]|nr:peptidoglycan-binding domain-containing protein [Conexibacter sp.]
MSHPVRTWSLVLATVALLALPASARAVTGGAAAGTTPPARSGGAAAGAVMLSRGARGPAVRALQRLLTRAGLPTPLAGVFGPQTERNVKRFQRRLRVRANGVVTARTLAALQRAAATRATPAPAPAPPAAGDPPGLATLRDDGTASPPAGAPAEVAAVIAAGNVIASLPYRWGGGHRAWEDVGYDCSGSVGYALHGGGLLDATSDSSGLMSYGEPGPGTWITIYANPDHVYMVVAGLRYDTSGADPSRWQAEMRSATGFTVRHPVGF